MSSLKGDDSEEIIDNDNEANTPLFTKRNTRPVRPKLGITVSYAAESSPSLGLGSGLHAQAVGDVMPADWSHSSPGPHVD